MQTLPFIVTFGGTMGSGLSAINSHFPLDDHMPSIVTKNSAILYPKSFCNDKKHSILSSEKADCCETSISTVNCRSLEKKYQNRHADIYLKVTDSRLLQEKGESFSTFKNILTDC